MNNDTLAPPPIPNKGEKELIQIGDRYFEIQWQGAETQPSFKEVKPKNVLFVSPVFAIFFLIAGIIGWIWISRLIIRMIRWLME